MHARQIERAHAAFFSSPPLPAASSLQPATILVHEATFEDEFWEDARAKRHSTISEAVAVGDITARGDVTSSGVLSSKTNGTRWHLMAHR